MKITVIFLFVIMLMLSVMSLYGLYRKINTLATKILFYAGSVALLLIYIITTLSYMFGIFTAG